MNFEPERFLTTHKDVDVRDQHFELIPFGSGREHAPEHISAPSNAPVDTYD
jgi:hypothetical protein